MEKISRTKVVDLLKREDFGAMVNVKGWVRTRRGSKQVNFIALNDGSTINNVQIVVDLGNFDEEIAERDNYRCLFECKRGADGICRFRSEGRSAGPRDRSAGSLR